MPRQALLRRLWQTVSLSGPLLLSGIASIVKIYVRNMYGRIVAIAELMEYSCLRLWVSGMILHVSYYRHIM
jgi:hypothetical protein